MTAVLPARLTVTAPWWATFLRWYILEARGELVLDADAFRWRPTGPLGRRLRRTAGFEVPLTEIGSLRLDGWRRLRGG